MVKAEPTSYENIRQQRMEENKKRMEELNLTKLAQDVRNASPKPSPMKPRTPLKKTTIVHVRRSSRVSKNPAPAYIEVSLEIVERPGRNSNRHRDLLFHYASNEARMEAIEKADALEAELGSDFPTFVKSMLPSHVSGGFWLGLPSNFCKTKLPSRGDTITLVDESGDVWPTVYLAHKAGLSGGWMGFSKAHELVDGDALVFQLVKPTEFKVYIIRANH